MTYKLNKYERLDDLLTHDLKIIQDEREFCFSLDAVLLAHFVSAKKTAQGLDLGTGTGVIPLLLSLRVKKIYGIELNPVTANLAKRNVVLNQLEDKIVILEGDYRQIANLPLPEQFDFVVANPPYRPSKHGDVNIKPGVATARHEITTDLDTVVAVAARKLKYHGRFAMVHLPERLGEIIVSMHRHNIAPKRLRFVQPKRNKKPNIVLIEGVFGGNIGGLQVDVPMIVHNDDGSYTEELLSYYYPAN